MSTPDASLSPQERAALADLEAAAAADDPQLAARLKGGGHLKAWSVPPRVAAFVVGRWKAALTLGWWGAPIAVVGFALMVLSLSTGLYLGVVGAGLCLFGLQLVAHAAHNLWVRRRGNEGAA
jgi:Protein of unknown function (DUF3040)